MRGMDVGEEQVSGKKDDGECDGEPSLTACAGPDLRKAEVQQREADEQDGVTEYEGKEGRQVAVGDQHDVRGEQKEEGCDHRPHALEPAVLHRDEQKAEGAEDNLDEQDEIGDLKIDGR